MCLEGTLILLLVLLYVHFVVQSVSILVIAEYTLSGLGHVEGVNFSGFLFFKAVQSLSATNMSGF